MIIQKIKDYLEESNSQGILINPEQLLELIGEWETDTLYATNPDYLLNILRNLLALVCKLYVLLMRLRTYF